MNIEICQAYCGLRYYTFAGLQDGQQCFCSNTYGAYGQVANTYCSMPCTGNSSETCGNAWLNAVYTSTNLGYAGCFLDSTPRDLPTQMTVASLTIEGCKAACLGGNFMYAGTQDGIQCWCGNSYGTYGSVSQAQYCNQNCSGDTTELCGSGWVNTVYKIK